MHWNKLPKKPKGQEQPHPYIENNDTCYYAREYKSGDKKFKTNQLIYSFKTVRQELPQGESITDLREKAIETISQEIADFFKPNGIYTITAIPSSKIKTDPKYDNRFEDLFDKLKEYCPYLKIDWPVENKKSIDHTKDLNLIKENYIWKGWKENPPERIFILDDVLTKGTHFRAISDFLKNNRYKGDIVGLFISKTTR